MDDIIFGSTNPQFSERFGRLMSEKYEMSMMCELKFFLGLQIKQTREGTFISQTKYTKDLIKKFNMQECKGMKTHMPTSGHVDLTKEDEPVDQKVYQSMISSLLYLCASRTDLMLSVCMCARYQAAPKECHLKAVKRIVRYWIHTPNFAFGIPRDLLLTLLAIPNRTMPEIRLIENPPRVLVNFWVDLLYLDPPRNKTRYLYLLPKLSILLLDLVVCNYYG